MRRRTFLQWLSAIGAWSGQVTGPASARPSPDPSGSDIELRTPRMELLLAARNGYGITRLFDPAAGQNFACSGGVPGLYRLTIVDATGRTRDIDSTHAMVISRKASDESIDLVFLHEAERLKVFCSARLDPETPRVSWKISLQNQGPSAVRSLFYPQWFAPPQLSADGKADRILYPFLDGQEFVAPGEHFTAAQAFRIQYPGQACLQMLAYHDSRSGLMAMTRDGEGWIKHFRVARVKTGFDLSIEHNPDETPGTPIDLPYEVSFEIFHGDWQEAADRYKSWAREQKWARQKLEERHVAVSLTEGLPILTYLLRGDAYSAEWSMYFPPSNRLLNPDFYPAKIPTLTNRYGDFFGSKVISNPFGWEHIAPWIAGDYFPPVGGEEAWQEASAALHAEGHKLFMLLSGTRWGVNMDDVGYHRYDEFMRTLAPQAAAYGPGGKPLEEWPPWAGSVVLCIGTPFTQEHLREAFLGCVRRGAEVVQFDQNHGGMAFPCYNRQHPHPAGYGRWMVQRMEELFGAVRAEASQLNPDFALAVEEPCEYFIPYFDLYMGRPYNFFGTGSDPSSYRTAVPLFIYVYHEYQLGYGGSNEIDIAHPYAEAIKVARKFTNGTLLEVDPGKPAFRLDTIPSPTEELQLVRSCLQALKTYAREYLIFGKRLRDPSMPELRQETVRMWRDPRDPRQPLDLPTVQIPRVLESTWEHNGKVSYVFANWQKTPQEVVFQPKPYIQKGTNFRLTLRHENENRVLQPDGPLPPQVRVTLPAFSALMVEQVSGAAT